MYYKSLVFKYTQTVYALVIQTRHFVNCSVLLQKRYQIGSVTTILLNSRLFPPSLAFCFAKQWFLFFHFFSTFFQCLQALRVNLEKYCFRFSSDVKRRISEKRQLIFCIHPLFMIVIYFLLLLYFYYFYLSGSTGSTGSTGKLVSPLPIPPLPQLVPTADRILFKDAAGSLLWSEPLPDSVQFQGQKLVYKDACGSKADGVRIAATGRPLYDYAKIHGFPSGGGYHFVCRGGRIDALENCSAGQIFARGKCLMPHPCVGRADGVKLRVEGDLEAYVECQDDQPLLKRCRKGDYFHHHTCLPKKGLIHYCKFFSDFLQQDERTRIECVGGKPVLHQCPEGQAFLGADRCESVACVGKQDGTRIGMPDVENNLFLYSPGYQECRNGRVADTQYCPTSWHPYDSRQDNLTHLPMAFDGKHCSIPQFCTNVRSKDPDIIVPVHDFGKRATNWKDAELYDSLSGTKCQNGIRIPWTALPGKRIVQYRESDGTGKVPIYQKPKEYFDSVTGQVETCQSDEQFNGHDCVKLLDDAFSHRGLQLFEFGGLEHHWIKGWGWTRETFTPVCKDPHVYLQHYNLCVHPKCKSYPFLKQIPGFEILLKGENKKCAIQPDSVLTVLPTDSEHDFWTQKKDVTETNTCTKGKIQTGHFVLDSSLHATCNPKQPFVFCPVETKIKYFKDFERYACEKTVNDTLKFEGPRTFIKNEILSVENKSVDKIKISLERELASGLKEVLEEELAPGSHFQMEKDVALILIAGTKLWVTYRYRPTYPPDIGYENGSVVGTKYNIIKGLCISKSSDEAKFSDKGQNYAMHNVIPAVKDF